MDKSRKITLADVAERANVSPITVSRALREPAKVSAAARDRIEAAIRATGYVPDPAARALASGRTDVIGVIIPSVTNNVFAEVLRGVYAGVEGSPFGIQLGNSRYSPVMEEDLIRVFLSQRPAGMIVTGHDQSPAARGLLAGANCPVVQIMETGSDPIDMQVGFSHYDAARAATAHLLDQGYRRPGFIGARMDPRSQRRLSGFQDQADQAGVLDPARIVTTGEPSSVSLGARLFADLIARHPETDAVFCNNDDLALGVLFECHRRHIAVPRALGIIGFNDLEMMAAAEPPLSSVSTDRRGMGERAIAMLRDRIGGGDPADRNVDLGYQLMARRSTARPPGDDILAQSRPATE